MSTTTTLVQDLRALADFAETNPEAVAHWIGQRFLISLGWQDHDPKAALADFIRAALAGGATITKNYSENWAGAVATFGSIELEAYASREQVCERVVTGTEVITKEIPDPEALAAVPTTTVTETVETVEWICKPLLADSAVA